MGGENSKQQPMFHKLSPNEQNRSAERQRKRNAKNGTITNKPKLPPKQAPATINSKVHGSNLERYGTLTSLSGTDDGVDNDIDTNPNNRLQKLQPLEPLPKVPPIMPAKTEAPRGAKRPKIRPPPPKSKAEPARENALVLERNLTLLSVTSAVDSVSVSGLTPRGLGTNNDTFKNKQPPGLSSNYSGATVNGGNNQTVGYGINYSQTNGLVPMDVSYKVAKSSESQTNQRIAKPRTVFVTSDNGTSSDGKSKCNDSKIAPKYDRNMTLVSMSSEI